MPDIATIAADQRVRYYQARERNHYPCRFVYAMWQPCICMTHMWVKIGTSQNPWYRWETFLKQSGRPHDEDLHPDILCTVIPIELRYLMVGGRKTESAMRHLVSLQFGVEEKRGEWLCIPCLGDNVDPTVDELIIDDRWSEAAGTFVDDCKEDYALESLFREFGGVVAPWFPRESGLYHNSSLEDADTFWSKIAAEVGR